MKKNLLAMFAIVLAIGFVSFSSFTKSTKQSDMLVDPVYYIFGSGDQDDIGNYTTDDEVPSTNCSGNATLCYFKVTDVIGDTPGSLPDGDVDFRDFDKVFDNFDTDNDLTLDDQ